MTIKEAAVQLRAVLSSYYEPREASAISDMVLEDLTGYSRVDRIIHDQQELSAGQLSGLSVAMKYLQLKMPVQYILGYTYFAGLRLKVNSQVLIPRPETEELVEWIRQTYNGASEVNIPETDKGSISILDIGTGSGCIPLALKQCFAEGKIYGGDISDGALGVARHNSRLTGLDVAFFKMDALDDSAAQVESLCQRLGPLDCIVSNPPYIDLADMAEMEPHVLDYEPHLALFPEKSLSATIFYEKIAILASKLLKPGGFLFFEINPLYVKETLDLLKKAGGDLIEIRRDLQGKDRMVKCLFKS